MLAQVYNLQQEYLIWADKMIFDEITDIEGDAFTREVINEFQRWIDMVNKGQILEEKYDQLLRMLRTKKN